MTPQNNQNDSRPDTGTPDLESLSARLDALQSTVNALQGRSFPLNLNTDILGLFETVSAVPTGIPKSPYDQIKIYVNGTTYRFYWYDATGHVWHYVTATA